MSSTERVAELQRIVYGAGATDGERAAAAGELEALRRAAAAGVEVGEATARPSATPLGGPAATGGSPQADIDPFDGLGGLGAVAEEAPRPASNPVRVAAIASVIALAIGFGAGWLFGAQSAAELTVPGASPDEDVTFDLEPVQRPMQAAVPGEVTALEVFAQAQVPEDMPSFVDPAFDPTSFRRLAVLPDGSSLHAARPGAGSSQVCIHFDVPEVGAMSTCDDEDRFLVGGLLVEGGFSGTFYRVAWNGSGEVSITTRPET